MKGYKYPYIPDKKMYAAVMGACSYIREKGWFNKAVSYYSDKYGVDPEELEKHIRARQGAGQKAKKATQRKYHWFAVEYSCGNERNGGAYFYGDYALFEVRKGLSSESVINTMTKYEDPSNEYEPHKFFGRIEQFDTKEEAEKKCSEWEEDKNDKKVRTL